MPQLVDIPGTGTVEFPDDATREEIEGAANDMDRTNQKRAALAEEGRQARIEGRMDELETQAADLMTATVKGIDPGTWIKRAMGLPFEIDRAVGLVPKDAVNPVEVPLLTPEHVASLQNSLRNLSKGESPWAATTEGQPGPVEQGVTDFENQTVSGMTTPDVPVTMMTGPGVASRLFQAQMIGSVPAALQNYLAARKSGDTAKTVTAALNVAASVGLPLAMEYGAGAARREPRPTEQGAATPGDVVQQAVAEQPLEAVQASGRLPGEGQAPEAFSFEEAKKPEEVEQKQTEITKPEAVDGLETPAAEAPLTQEQEQEQALRIARSDVGVSRGGNPEDNESGQALTSAAGTAKTFSMNASGKSEPTLGPDTPVDEFVKLMAKRDDLIGTLRVPPGWKLKDIQTSTWHSVYWLVEDPEGETVKIRIADHEPTKTVHGPNNYHAVLPKQYTLTQFRDSMQGAQQWLARQAGDEKETATPIAESGGGIKAKQMTYSGKTDVGPLTLQGNEPQRAASVKHSMATGAGATLRTAPPVTRVVPAGPLPPAAGRMGALTPVKSHWTRLRQGMQALFSPQNIDPQAKSFSFVLRENNARAALDLVRADEHLGELRGFFDKTPVPKDWAYDPNRALPHNFAVMDALERDRAKLALPLQDWANTMDAEFAQRIAEVQKLKPGAMQQLIQNYFPHMWEQPDSDQVQHFLKEANAPLEGSKGFLKQRSLPLTVDGLARGLRPISDNPVDLALAKLHQMDKFIMAQRTMAEAKERGWLKYYPLNKKVPAGEVVVKDPAFTVYAPPVVKLREAYDAGIRKGLVDFMGKMGFTHERVAKLGVNEWGQYTQGGEIKSRFGGPDFAIMHEIGHGLQERYNLLSYLASNSALKGELSALADLRGKGVSASRKFKKYIQTPDEQVANAVHAYIYASDVMTKTAPNVQKVLYNLTRQFPELGDLNEIKPGLALDSAEMELPVGGPMLMGRWALPEGAAAVLGNFLSPGLGKWAPFRTLRTASNILNGAQLGLSAFHAGFTSVDAMVSSAATAMGYALRGDLPRAAKSGLFTTVAPVANYYVGKAVQMKMIEGSSGASPHLALRVPVLDFPRLWIKGFSVGLSPTADAMVKNIAELAVKGGLRADLDPFWKTHITRNLVRAFNEGGVKNYAKAGMQLPFALVEQAMRPIAEYLVPRQKLGVFAQLALQEMNRIGWNAGPEEVRAGMARAADWTEDRMGQMTYDNLFYNKVVKDAALLGFRAYGWQLGKYRHLFGGVADTMKLLTSDEAWGVKGAKDAEVTNRMLYPVALTMVASVLGALTQKILSGKNPQSLQDYMFPQSGQMGNDGRPQRLMLPTYLKDLVSDWKDFPSFYPKMAASFYHKLNPGIAAVVDMVRNQDYYGVEIWHPDDPLAKQLKDLSLFALKQFEPFSISRTMKLAEAKSPTAQLVLPFFGIVPAKRALTMTPAETLAGEIIRSSLPVGARTQEQADHSQMLKKIVQDMRNVPGAKVDTSQLRTGDEKTLVSMLTLKPLQYQVHKMSPEDAMRVWRLANAEERGLLQQQVALKLANSKTLDPVKRTAMLNELVK